MTSFKSTISFIYIFITSWIPGIAQHWTSEAEASIAIDSIEYKCSNLIWPHVIAKNSARIERNDTVEFISIDSIDGKNIYNVKIYSIRNKGIEPYVLWFTYDYSDQGNNITKLLHNYFFRYRSFVKNSMSLFNILNGTVIYDNSRPVIDVGGMSLKILNPDTSFLIAVIYNTDLTCSYTDKMVFVSKQDVETFLQMPIPDNFVFKEDLLVINNFWLK